MWFLIYLYSYYTYFHVNVVAWSCLIRRTHIMITVNYYKDRETGTVHSITNLCDITPARVYFNLTGILPINNETAFSKLIYVRSRTGLRYCFKRLYFLCRYTHYYGEFKTVYEYADRSKVHNLGSMI